ncbi:MULTISPECIES: PcfK-like family protein [unclassified Carboxylicivirga]|uniref:PcfK-like family protein n=1 Tax=Carboxylicivirga TaxID=1628153 RepID=UPI003D33ECB1
MKSTQEFKQIIKAELEARAASDALFAANYAKAGKSIDDCITYIINTVKASGCNAFAPDEVYAMAAHYYDEDNIKVGKPVQCRVVTNRPAKQFVELSDEEKAQAKEEAKKQAIAEEVARQKEKLTRKAAKANNQPNSITQTSLFG